MMNDRGEAAQGSRKIAIWGSYQYSNFGDDLMAVMFAGHARRLGLDPWVYCLHPRLAERVGCRTTDDIDELLSGARACSMGGGAWLSDRASWPPGDYRESLRLLATGLKRHGLVIRPLSIGGDGRMDSESVRLLPEMGALWREGLCEPTTLRLGNDLPLVLREGGRATVAPDVLWGVHEWFAEAGYQCTGDSDGAEPWRMKGHHVMKVGLHLPKHEAGPLVEAWTRRAASDPRLQLFWFTSFLDRPSWGEHSSKVEAPNHHNLPYRDPIDMCDQLASMDLVISHKLHVGLVALAAGVPFLSAHGPPKARSFLSEIEPSWLVDDRILAGANGAMDRLRLWWFVNRRCGRGNVARWKRRLRRKNLENWRERSRHHLAPISALAP